MFIFMEQDKVADIAESQSTRNKNSPINEDTFGKEREDVDIPILKREYEIGIVYDFYSISSVPSLILSLCFSCLCILIAFRQYLQTV